jgi:hypothetical protein
MIPIANPPPAAKVVLVGGGGGGGAITIKADARGSVETNTVNAIKQAAMLFAMCAPQVTRVLKPVISC